MNRFALVVLVALILAGCASRPPAVIQTSDRHGWTSSLGCPQPCRIEDIAWTR